MTATVAELGERVLRRLGVAVVPVANRPLPTISFTADAIATNALMWLSVMAADETPAPLDQALALSKVQAVHASLVAQALVFWEDGAIPAAVSEEYTILTALHLAASFGKTADPAQIPVMEARIRRAVLVLSAPDLANTAVMSVHNDLAMRGKARWTVFDIPDAVGDCYVVLASATLAPSFQVKTDPRDEMAASISLARYIALPSSGRRVAGEYF